MSGGANSSPAAFFASELKRLREKAGLTRDELASEVLVGPDMIVSIENARRKPSKDLAQRADELFETDGQLVRLQALVEETWVLSWYRGLFDTERRAQSIQTYEAYLVPGLLEVEDYARHAISAIRPRLADEDIERAVALRMARQEILRRDNPPRLWAIIDESVLRRLVGGSAVMEEQCDHLLRIGRLPHIAIQVVPDSRGATCAYGHPFIILTLPNKSVMAYLEDMHSARYLRQRSDVNVYTTVFEYLRSNALDDQQSEELIREYGERYAESELA